MKVAASVCDLRFLGEAFLYGADLVEIRLDLMKGASCDQILSSIKSIDIPVLLTMRSEKEGGSFTGDANEWWEMIEPFLPAVDMVDIEQSFREHAPRIREMDKTVIASYHSYSMPERGEMETIGRTLRTYGHIPKIVPRPRDNEDLLSLFSFTYNSPRPVITSVMGEEFRFARIILGFFGSEILFSYVGNPASPGQYHLKVVKSLVASLS